MKASQRNSSNIESELVLLYNKPRFPGCLKKKKGQRNETVLRVPAGPKAGPNAQRHERPMDF